jgi:hypothetical protein
LPHRSSTHNTNNTTSNNNELTWIALIWIRAADFRCHRRHHRRRHHHQQQQQTSPTTVTAALLQQHELEMPSLTNYRCLPHPHRSSNRAICTTNTGLPLGSTDRQTTDLIHRVRRMDLSSLSTKRLRSRTLVRLDGFVVAACE